MPESRIEEVSNETYDAAFFERLFSIEDRHFWFRSRNDIIGDIVRNIVSDLPDGYRILEVGCGTGSVLKTLEQVCSRGMVMGLDQHEEGLQFARKRTNCTLIQGDARTMMFDERFHVIGLFDVLEHLPDDVRMLADLRDLLVPGGALILTVPALQSLWSYFDEASHHCRRYDREELKVKLEEAGYRVEFVSYYMFALFPLIWLGRRLAPLFSRESARTADREHEMAVQELRIVPVLNELLLGVLQLDRMAISRRLQLPVGTSLVAVARRSA